MKLTNERLRELYLEDLGNPDVFHGRTTPKVKHPGQWSKIVPNQGRDINALDVSAAISNLIAGVPDSPNVWIWSDIHFGHKNIMKYAGRPFPTAGLMNDCLIGNYLNVVKPGDIVLWNGDIGFMPETEINKILDSLPGYKIHIIGNHDMHRDGKLYKLHMDEQYLCYAIDVVDSGIEFQLLLTHYPMDKVPSMTVNVHGHIHQNLANPWNINVCVEHTGYAPRNLMDVIAHAKSYLEEQA